MLKDFKDITKVPKEHLDVHSLIQEAKILSKEHPAKDIRFFAKQVLITLDKASFIVT